LFKKEKRPKKIVYGYLPYWTLNKKDFIQYNRLTDIAFFGLHIDSDGTFRTVNEEGQTLPGYAAWRENEQLDAVIKESKRNGVRVALTVISHNDPISDEFLNCRSCWDTLLVNIKKQLDHRKIRDVNFNFEYVEYTEENQAELYAEFIELMNTELDKAYGESFVVVPTFADSLLNPRVTSNIETLAKVSDGLFIMAYDFHRPNSDNAGPVAPIDGKGIHAEYDIRTMLEDYLAVAPPNKITMGVPYYGYNWVVEDSTEYAKRIEGNDDIGFSQSQTYEDVMETVLEVNPYISWDELGQTPFFTYVSPETGQTREVYYEDKDSLEVKYDLINENRLAGVGIWAIGYDGGYMELWNLLYEKFVR
jgi:spore germination protein